MRCKSGRSEYSGSVFRLDVVLALRLNLSSTRPVVNDNSGDKLPGTTVT